MLSNEEYRARKIVGKQELDGKVYYLVRWHDSWEPLENCVAAKPLIDEFEASQLPGKHRRSKSIDGKHKILKPVKSPATSIAEMSERCRRLRISNISPSPNSTNTFTDAPDSEKKKELLEHADSEIEILGAFPSNQGSLTLGLRIKGRNRDEDICHIDKDEVKILWPNLYMAFLETRIIFR